MPEELHNMEPMWPSSSAHLSSGERASMWVGGHECPEISLRPIIHCS